MILDTPPAPLPAPPGTVNGYLPNVNDFQSRRDSDGKWVDGDPSYVRVVVWRDLAEHVAQSVSKGTRLVISGRFEERSYETREGEKKYAWELTGDDVAASLRFATATINKVVRSAPAVHDERPTLASLASV